MLSLRLLEKIDNSVIGDFVSRKQDIIERTNPDKIYVENVRAFFNVSSRTARFLCEKAVAFGFFEKFLGLQCPIHGNIIFSSKQFIEHRKVIKCTTCEDLGFENYEYFANDLKSIVFYRLIKKNK